MAECPPHHTSKETRTNKASKLNITPDISIEPKTASLVQRQDEIDYLTGGRFYFVCIVACVVYFLVQVETTIVTTSIVAITKDLGGFESASWVFASYLLGYVGVIVIMAKLSDIYGRKFVYITAILIFTVFSAACAASQTMNQLIILRAFQGVGGGGCFGLTTIVIADLVPLEKKGVLIGYIGLSVVLGMIVGPILGGAISSRTTWRWIFLLNVPSGVLAAALAYLAIPQGYPSHLHPRRQVNPRELLARIDWLGCMLLFSATLSTTAAFQQVGSEFSWGSAYFITLAAVSIVIWMILVIWERSVTAKNGAVEPVLPWRFLKDRAILSMLIGSFLVGGPFVVLEFQLPQRFQLVSGLSGLSASIRIVPYGAAVSFGIMVASTIAEKWKVAYIYVNILGASMQIVGFALLVTLQDSTHFNNGVYGYMILAGMGAGISIHVYLLAMPIATTFRDQGAVGLSSVSQFRVMGSAVVLAVVTSIFNNNVLDRLGELQIQNPATLTSLSSNSGLAISPEVRGSAQKILSHGYNLQMLVLCACAAGQLIVGFFMWKKPQIRSV